MAAELFEASKIKLKRARVHIEALREAILDYLRPHPVVLEVAPGPTPDKKAWVVRVSNEAPRELAAIAGDAVHNLRSALDLMACELVRLNGKDDKNVRFPFSASEAEFDNALSWRQMDKAAPDVVDLLKSMKPYRGGNEALRGIHDLDILDKHQMLIPTIQYAGAMPLTIQTPIGPVEFTDFSVVPARDGELIGLFAVNLPVPIGTKHLAMFGLALPAGAPFEHREMLHVLEDLAKLVAGIIEKFEMLCAGRQSPVA
ncbi:MAG TPA: hypothetical protein VN802_19950 [Stellaceae bacterium]|nr:hypothetical protein [Stellaceae bacterium]